MVGGGVDQVGGGGLPVEGEVDATGQVSVGLMAKAGSGRGVTACCDSSEHPALGIPVPLGPSLPPATHTHPPVWLRPLALPPGTGPGRWWPLPPAPAGPAAA